MASVLVVDDGPVAVMYSRFFLTPVEGYEFAEWAAGNRDELPSTVSLSALAARVSEVEQSCGRAVSFRVEGDGPYTRFAPDNYVWCDVVHAWTQSGDAAGRSWSNAYVFLYDGGYVWDKDVVAPARVGDSYSTTCVAAGATVDSLASFDSRKAHCTHEHVEITHTSPYLVMSAVCADCFAAALDFPGDVHTLFPDSSYNWKVPTPLNPWVAVQIVEDSSLTNGSVSALLQHVTWDNYRWVDRFTQTGIDFSTDMALADGVAGLCSAVTMIPDPAFERFTYNTARLRRKDRRLRTYS